MNKPISSLIYLGGTGPYTIGIQNQGIHNYMTKKENWGNIFHPDYLTGRLPVLTTTLNTIEVEKLMEQHTSTLLKDITGGNPFHLKTTSNIVQCRYNPFADKGIGNIIFLAHNNKETHTWEPPEDEKLLRKDLPLWLITFGWLDWQKKQNSVSLIDTSWMTVIKSPYISPPQTYYLLLDDTFLTGRSPYSTTLNTPDDKFFYPKNSFQLKSINEMGTTGPGIVKLAPTQSCEAHFNYNFHFKLGGCPAPMEKICNPCNQPKYPIPDTKQSPPSLQSPNAPIQTFLYNFDERQGVLTTKAAKRIKKDYGPEKLFVPFTGTAMDLQPSHQETQETDSSDSEKEEESLQLELLRLRSKQQKLKQRILKLMDLQNLE